MYMNESQHWSGKPASVVFVQTEKENLFTAQVFSYFIRSDLNLIIELSEGQSRLSWLSSILEVASSTIVLKAVGQVVCSFCACVGFPRLPPTVLRHDSWVDGDSKFFLRMWVCVSVGACDWWTLQGEPPHSAWSFWDRLQHLWPLVRQEEQMDGKRITL